MAKNWDPADAPRTLGLQIIDEHCNKINEYGIDVLFDYQAGGVRAGGKERMCSPKVKKGWDAYKHAGRPSSVSPENPKPILPYFIIFVDQKAFELATPERRLYEMHMALKRCSAEKDEESGQVICKVLPFAYEGDPDIMALYGPQTSEDRRFVKVAHGQMAMLMGSESPPSDDPAPSANGNGKKAKGAKGEPAMAGAGLPA